MLYWGNKTLPKEGAKALKYYIGGDHGRPGGGHVVPMGGAFDVLDDGTLAAALRARQAY